MFTLKEQTLSSSITIAAQLAISTLIYQELGQLGLIVQQNLNIMTNEDFMESLQDILNDPDIPQSAINKIAIAIALDAKSMVINHRLSCSGELRELQEMVVETSKNVDRLADIVEKHDRYNEQHPSIVYLMRFRTRETIVVIVFIFAILSLWWVSTIRQAILQFLGLPSF